MIESTIKKHKRKKKGKTFVTWANKKSAIESIPLTKMYFGGEGKKKEKRANWPPTSSSLILSNGKAH